MSNRLCVRLATFALTLGCLLAADPDKPAKAPEKRHIETARARELDDAALNRAADSVGKDRAAFKETAKRDGDLRIVTSNGRPAYACRPPRFAQKAAARASANPGVAREPVAAVSPSNVGTDTSPYINDAPFPLDRTFALHTRPGAARILFLDFDGCTVHATDWNDSNRAADDIVVPPFDTDGDPTTFSAAERRDIQEVWRRVAEDFAPFDVDVTTEDPGMANLLYDGPGDDHWGSRMACGGRADDVLGPGNYGVIGVAYLDTFRQGFSYDSDGNPGTDTPAFTFAADIIDGDPTTYAAEIASTAAHEFGHTLGLSHDGDNYSEYYGGYYGWAPIMGSGDPLDVVQWSKGEYTRANNKEDDLALIADYYLPYLAPDHGTAGAGAQALASGETAGGIILRAADTAWYRIQAGAGPLSVTGSVATPDHGNLKMKLSLVDLAGNTLATSPSGAKMAASLDTVLATSGTFYLVVDGTSYLTPSTGFSDYDSVGRYSLTGTWSARTSNLAPLADLGGTQPLVGIAPLGVVFSGSASRDTDGIIAGYAWDFGDGSPVSTVANPTHTYASTGDYTVTLTVTDNDGATASASATVSAINLPPGARTLSVGKMSGSWKKAGRGAETATCTVVIRDDAGRPLANVLVNASTSGLVSENLSARTDRSGKAVLATSALTLPPSSQRPKDAAPQGEVVFTVTNANLPGFYYYPPSNRVSTLAVPRR